MTISSDLLRDADRLLQKGDLTKASEKYWEAAQDAIETVARAREWPCEGHRDVLVAASRISQDDETKELIRLFASALSLFSNINENWLAREDVEVAREDVARFVKRLDAMAHATG